MGRESRQGPQDTGRFAYLGPDERPDSSDDRRSRIIYRHPFWKDEDERIRYEKAVHACPLYKYGHLDMFGYLREVAMLAAGMAGEAVKSMPDAHPWEDR